MKNSRVQDARRAPDQPHPDDASPRGKRRGNKSQVHKRRRRSSAREGKSPADALALKQWRRYPDGSKHAYNQPDEIQSDGRILGGKMVLPGRQDRAEKGQQQPGNEESP